MFFKDAINEESLESKEQNAEDQLLGVNTDENDMDSVANEINAAMDANALVASATMPGGEAVREFVEGIMDGTIQALSEGIIAAKAKSNTVIQINARDDMKRRARLGCLILARNANDPLFKRLSTLRAKERALKKLLYKKYIKKAYAAARLSVRKHAVDIKKQTDMPKFQKDRTGNRTSFALINTPEVR